MERESVTLIKSKSFAIRIVKLYQYLTKTPSHKIC